LSSPAVWIESQRRIRSAREMKLLELARLEAQAEGIDADSIDELIAARLLPVGFGQRSDGSQLLFENELWRDSVRGRAGYFAPVGEIEVASVTPAEAAAYRAFSQ